MGLCVLALLLASQVRAAEARSEGGGAPRQATAPAEAAQAQRPLRWRLRAAEPDSSSWSTVYQGGGETTARRNDGDRVDPPVQRRAPARPRHRLRR